MAKPTKPAKRTAKKATPKKAPVDLHLAYMELAELAAKRQKKKPEDFLGKSAGLILNEWGRLATRPIPKGPKGETVKRILQSIDPITDPVWEDMPVGSKKWRRELLRLEQAVSEAAEVISANAPGKGGQPTIKQINECVHAATLLRDRLVILMGWIKWAHTQRLLTDEQLTAANFD